MNVPPNATGIPEIDALTDQEARDTLAELFRRLYWNERRRRWDPDKSVGGADTVELLCGLMPEPRESLENRQYRKEVCPWAGGE